MNIKIPSSSNLNLSASIIKSQQKCKKLAILMPGFLDSKNYLHLVRLAEDLTKYDYNTVRFDPLGVWNSQGGIALYSVSQYLKDLTNVIKYCQKKYSINKIVLLGHSLGGMIALLYGALNPDKISAVVGIMPPPSQISPKGYSILKIY